MAIKWKHEMKIMETRAQISKKIKKYLSNFFIFSSLVGGVIRYKYWLKAPSTQ